MTENMETTSANDTGALDEGNTQAQAESKMFTQDDVDRIVQKRIAQMKTRAPEIDVNEYKELKSFKESIEEEQLIKRQDFDAVLSKYKEKSTTEINNLRSELTKIKVDGALISAASKEKAIAPEKVAALLKDQIRLQDDGSTAVVDDKGQVRYTADAEPMTVDDLVREFLDSNSYFRNAGPTGTNSRSNTIPGETQSVDLNKLDLTKPGDRELYRKLKASGQLM
jgi:hypothetical protein